MTEPITVHALVLRTSALRESDLVVSLLTEPLGRIAAVAPGARRSKQRFPGGIDVFDAVEFGLSHTTRSLLYRIVSVGNRESWPALRSHLPSFVAAAYCIELASAFTAERDASGGVLFAPLRRTLRRLNCVERADHAAALAVAYNLRVLEESGFGGFEEALGNGAASAAEEGVGEWCRQMTASDTVIVPSSAGLIRNTLVALVHYNESITEQQLRSAADLLQFCA